jgi:hypothetical protein
LGQRGELVRQLAHGTNSHAADIVL